MKLELDLSLIPMQKDEKLNLWLNQESDSIAKLIISVVKKPLCENCGDEIEHDDCGYCQNCSMNWPGDTGMCQCQDCGANYTRDSPRQSAYRCYRCEKYYERSANVATLS